MNRYVVEQGLLNPVYFDYDRSGLGDDARSTLQRNAAFMREHPEFVVTIEGHCDERGTIEYNLGLGQLRASSARGYLSDLGVPKERMRTVSFGREKPFCTEAREACWSSNRRAHFAITDRR
ncbi:MAG TPA: peptidoglycan-associated lipoprotein Pal [Candidatus Polarisedimenticolia bacterium]|nr:peptidoglycan-associated lipoprotein Pal [Candidatus Polarisedimenticolia bacterium]